MMSVNVTELVGAQTNKTPPSGLPAVDIVIITINAVLCPVTAFANLLVLVVLQRYRELWTLPNMTVANLAFADLLSATFGLPFYTAMQFSPLHLYRSKYICMAGMSFIIFFIFITIASINVIALERYLAVVYPFFYKTPRAGHVIIGTIFGTWLFGIVIMVIAPMAGWNKWKPNNLCSLQYTHSRDFAVTMAIFLILLLASATVQYVRIALVVKKHRNAIRKQRQIVRQTSEGKQTKRLNRMLLILLGLYYACVAPYLIVSVTKLFHGDVEPLWLTVVTRCMVSFSLVNSLINPIVYCSHNKAFRLGFKKMICHATSTPVAV